MFVLLSEALCVQCILHIMSIWTTETTLCCFLMLYPTTTCLAFLQLIFPVLRPDNGNDDDRGLMKEGLGKQPK